MTPLTDFHIKQNDTGEAIIADLSGSTKDFTGAIVVFHMMTNSGTTIIAVGAASVVGDPADKTVGYQWQAGDTATASWTSVVGFTKPHQAEFQVTFLDGVVETFPNSGNINVHVFPEIA